MENQIIELQNYLSNKQQHLLIFTDTNSEMNVRFEIPIELRTDMNYKVALLWFSAYNTVFNVIDGVNNMFYFFHDEKAVKQNLPYSLTTLYKLRLPSGAYEFTQISDEIERQMKALGFESEIKLTIDTTTSKTRLELLRHDLIVCFDYKNNLKDLFGFTQHRYWYKKENSGIFLSEKVVNITSLSTINIECSIISNSYMNGKQKNILYSFPSYTVPIGYKIIERISHPTYLPVHKTSTIGTITIRIVDENGDLIDFNGEEIALALELKQV